METANKSIQKYTEIIKPFKKPFATIACIYLIAISAILRANFNYIDDMERVASGQKGWDNFSRYLSNFFSTFIHADTYLTDISPFTQILAVLILAASGVILLYVITNNNNFNYWQCIALVPLGLSPYFLECISYKYDSVYMALSIFASIAPLLLKNKKTILYCAVSIAGILVVCTTYQAASGIFPMLVVFLAVRDWIQHQKEEKEILKFIFTSIVGYGIGLMIFKTLLMKPIDTYVSNSIPGLNTILSGSLAHLKQYYIYVVTDFKTEWLVLIFIMCIAYVLVMIKDSLRNKFLTLIVSVLSLAIMAGMAFGLYPVLESPLYSPRAMYGFGVFIAIISITISSTNRAYFGKLVCVILSWAFFVFAFTYGNALYSQSEYTNYRISMVIDDLNDLEIFNTEEIKTVQIPGSIGYSPVIRNMPQDYQMLNRLIPITFREEWLWGAYGFVYYYDIKNIQTDQHIDLITLELPVLKDTMYHTIRGDNTHVLIELK